MKYIVISMIIFFCSISSFAVEETIPNAKDNSAIKPGDTTNSQQLKDATTTQQKEISFIDKVMAAPIENQITWILTIFISGIATSLYYRRQVNIAKAQRNIARFTALREIDKDIVECFKVKSVRQRKLEGKKDCFDEKEFRAVLDIKPPWKFIPDESIQIMPGVYPPKSEYINGQRHWLIRELDQDSNFGDQYLASQSFQESLLWFRRVAFAHKQKIVSDDDLVELWRYILPFGFAGRIFYFANYFQDKEDIQSMVYVINATLKRCCKRKFTTPIRYFQQHVTDIDKEILCNNSKNRKLIDLVKKISDRSNKQLN